MIKHRTKSISASFLVSAYTLAPLLTHAVYAEEYDPFDGCNPAETTCTVKPPEFSLSAIAHFGDYILNYVMYMVVSIINVISTIGCDLFERTTSDIPGVGLIATGWKYPVVGSFISFFTAVAITMCSIGIIIAFAEAAIAYANGQGNLAGTFVNIIKTIVYTTVFATVFIQVFTTIINIGPQIISGTVDASVVVASGVGTAGSTTLVIANIVYAIMKKQVTIGLTITIAVLIFLAIAAFKFALMMAKRCVMFFVLLAEGSVIPFTMARGYAGNFQSYIQKVLMFLIACLVQIWFYAMGFSFFKQSIDSIVGNAGSMIPLFVLGWAFVTTGEKVYSLLGTIGSDGTKPIGEALHAAGSAYRTMTMTCLHNDVHGGGGSDGSNASSVLLSNEGK